MSNKVDINDATDRTSIILAFTKWVSLHHIGATTKCTKRGTQSVLEEHLFSSISFVVGVRIVVRIVRCQNRF